jgi:hypothetical protein
MRERCGARLPRFTPEQSELLAGSADFFALNHYSSHLCEEPEWFKGGEKPGLTARLAAAVSRSRDDAGERARGRLSTRPRVRSVCPRPRLRASPPPTPDPPPSPLPPPPLPTPNPPDEGGSDAVGYWQDVAIQQSNGDGWKTTDMGWGVHPEGIRKVLGFIQVRPGGGAPWGAARRTKKRGKEGPRQAQGQSAEGPEPRTSPHASHLFPRSACTPCPRAQAEFAPKGGILITENGAAVREDSLADALKDVERAVYLKKYLAEVHKAISQDGVDVKGYFVW